MTSTLARYGNGLTSRLDRNARRWLRTAIAAGMVAAFVSAASPAMGVTGEVDAELADTVGSASLSGSFLAGQVAAKNNDDQAAVAFYERSLTLDPDNDELKRLYFLALTTNGRITDAVAVARELGPDAQDDTFMRLVLAVDALKRKSWAQVGERLKERSRGDLDNLVESVVAGWALFGAGQADAAAATIDEVPGPDWVEIIAAHHLGLMAAARGDDATAVGHFEEATANRSAAVVLSETFLRSVEAHVRSLTRLDRFEEARQALDEGLQLLPNHPPFHRLGEELAEGRALAPLVTSADQGGAEIFYNVGAALNRQNNRQFAQSYLKLAFHLDDESDPIAMALAGVFENQERHERANGFYERIGDNSPYHRRAELEYALNLNELEKVDEAKTVLRALIEEDPDELLAYATLGGVLSQHQDYDEAAKVYDTAVSKIDEPQPHHWTLFYRRGIAYERLKQWEKAEPNFEKALELSPNQPDVLNYLGYSWIDMGINLEEGMDLIRKAVELRPRSGYIVDSLGWAYYRLGQYEDAVRELEKAVELMPEDPVINDHLGDAYWKAGRRLEAIFQWNHSLASDPTEENAAKTREKLEKGLVEDGPPTAANQQ